MNKVTNSYILDRVLLGENPNSYICTNTSNSLMCEVGELGDYKDTIRVTISTDDLMLAGIDKIQADDANSTSIVQDCLYESLLVAMILKKVLEKYPELKILGIDKEKVQKAIVETKGEILTYQGKCISALFYSSSNGKSENVENYFKGSSQPYLVSVDSHWDQEYDSQFIRKVKYTKAQLNSLFGGSFQYRFLEHYPSGRVKSILINQKQYSGREVREKLQLSSSDFEIVKEGNSYISVTKGCGHGVGLSQYGAQGMAKEGYNYQAILKHYYQGVEISKNKE